MLFKFIISKSAIFLSLLNSLAPWNVHCSNRDCLSRLFTEQHQLCTEEMNLLNEYLKVIERTKYGEVEYCFFHEKGLNETKNLTYKVLHPKDAKIIEEVIDIFSEPFNAFYNKLLSIMELRKSQLIKETGKLLFKKAFVKCSYIFEYKTQKVIPVFIVPSLKPYSSGTVLNHFRDQNIIILDVFNIKQINYTKNKVAFSLLVLLHEFCHYALGYKVNNVNKALLTLRGKYGISNTDLLNIEEILILTVYPTGILAVQSKLVPDLKLEAKRNISGDRIGEIAEKLLGYVETQINFGNTFSHLPLLEDVYLAYTKQ